MIPTDRGHETNSPSHHRLSSALLERSFLIVDWQSQQDNDERADPNAYVLRSSSCHEDVTRAPGPTASLSFGWGEHQNGRQLIQQLTTFEHDRMSAVPACVVVDTAGDAVVTAQSVVDVARCPATTVGLMKVGRSRFTTRRDSWKDLGPLPMSCADEEVGVRVRRRRRGSKVVSLRFPCRASPGCSNAGSYGFVGTLPVEWSALVHGYRPERARGWVGVRQLDRDLARQHSRATAGASRGSRTRRSSCPRRSGHRLVGTRW